MSLNHLATRFTCSWPWTTAVLLCDGRVVCGCADPYGQRVLGDLRQAPLAAVWTGDRVAALRGDLNAGGSSFCGDCPLKLPLAPGEAPEMRLVRFRTLGCYPLTGAIESNAASLEAIVAEMMAARTSERGGRVIDREAGASMERKKREGYF
jgi:3'-phosphoadenosine 5'-phosphosulfate sulfotransferase (PAPS reductase)/FAD synthetase